MDEAIDDTFEQDPRPPPGGPFPLGVRRWLLPLPPPLPMRGALVASA